MHPRPFRYVRPGSLEDAVGELAGHPGSKVLAGGQSLIPMLSLGLTDPPRLVDISRLELGGVSDQGGRVMIGALTRHRQLELDPQIRRLLPLASEAARHIGNPRVRNRGTFGGSVAHADPAAELAAVALAHGGKIVTWGPDGERRIPIDAFFVGPFETALEPLEILTAIELEPPPPQAGWGFAELAQRADDFAIAGCAVLLDLAHDGEAVRWARFALCGAGSAPSRCRAAEAAIVGGTLDEGACRKLARAVHEAVETEDDAFVSAAFRGRAASACARRAALLAHSRARERVR